MIVGVPREIKTLEYRVGLVPSSVREFVDRGHRVLVESGAGVGINFSDGNYIKVGAEIVEDPATIFESSDLIIKVKEPQLNECEMLREGQVLFTYLHLAADKLQAEALMGSKCIAIAYETVTGDDGHGLPLLQPMSEVAGRLSVQEGAHHLQKHKGGLGRLMGGVPGVSAVDVLILGGGVAGFHAAQMAVGLQAHVTILERSEERMKFLQEYFGDKARVVYSDDNTIAELAPKMDLIIGAVLIPGASAPRLISKDMLKTFKSGCVMVDIAIDQGGCFETSKPTTHDDPTYIIDDVVHYCVANMPGAVPLTSALALNHAILPYALKLAEQGWRKALSENSNFLNGLNVCMGQISHAEVAESLDLRHVDPKTMI